MSNPADKIMVQVCYARPGKAFLEDVLVASDATLEQAIRTSGVLSSAPEIDLAVYKVGIYGKLKTLDAILRERDRIEIYRPLQADPKEARRRRVFKKEKAR
ncbi:MAG TPA: RnfH family protein [Oxalobacteraceae bacterium]|nr:RnfH family protein [Oxalobacteraceae bacterium]